MVSWDPICQATLGWYVGVRRVTKLSMVRPRKLTVEASGPEDGEADYQGQGVAACFDLSVCVSVRPERLVLGR